MRFFHSGIRNKKAMGCLNFFLSKGHMPEGGGAFSASSLQRVQQILLDIFKDLQLYMKMTLIKTNCTGQQINAATQICHVRFSPRTGHARFKLSVILNLIPKLLLSNSWKKTATLKSEPSNHSVHAVDYFCSDSVNIKLPSKCSSTILSNSVNYIY